MPPPARLLSRTSLDSCARSGAAWRDQAEQNFARLRKSSGECTRSTTKRSSKVLSTRSSCSKDKLTKDASIQSKPRKSCCSAGETANTPKIKKKCTNECCSPKHATMQPVMTRRGSNTSCSGNQELERYPTRASFPGYSGPEHKTGNDNCTKEISASSCCSNADSVTGSPSGPCVSYCCDSGKTALAKEVSDASRGNTCCKPSTKEVIDTGLTGCCSPERQTVNRAPGSCADGCCSSPVTDHGVKVETDSISAIVDTENQGTGTEHVVLSVSGLTCTGCETKLNRTLATLPAIKNLKTSLILSRAEFDIDLRLSSVGAVVKHLERTTEFKCERIPNQGSSLDFIIDDEPPKFLSQTWPEGVIDITLVGKSTIRVAFDAKIVGARDLAENTWGPRIKLAPPRSDPALEAGNKHVHHVGYMTLLSAVLTIPVLIMAWAPLPEHELAYSSASLALATLVQIVVAGPFYPMALKALVFSRVVEMDLLIVLSTSAAYIYSVISFAYLVAGRPLSTGQFFETSTLLVTLIMVGRWVAALARQRAIASISIRSLQAPKAILIDSENGTEREIDARLLQYGDKFKVLPDAKIPTDGVVLTGSSEVDESMLTGESRPVEKYPKSTVIAGTINGHGVMTVQLSRLPGENTIHAIAAIVDKARLSKPKLQNVADRVASYFVPVVVALTLLTFVIWVAIGIAVHGYAGSEAVVQATTYAITVLIVSCPCAIGLAVPMVIVVASGAAAERGVIFKSADAIEVAYKTSHVVFDKTGTLTRGKLSVVANECIDPSTLPLLRGLVGNNQHPVSVAVAAHLRDIGITTSPVRDPKSLTGKGIEATLDERTLRIGNSRWLNLSDHGLVQPMLLRDYTVVCFTVNGELKAVYGLKDELRPDSAGTIATLQRQGVSVHMVSGDDDGAVQTLASTLKIPIDNVRSRSSPTDKQDYIQALLGSATDRKKPVVVFCGDGTNDAVALAQATIGVHVNEGTDVAQSAADVVLMRPSLAGILTMMNVSRKSIHRIKLNFAWSFVYNIFAVLLAAGAFVNARIPPEFAGLGELVSVLPVIAAAVLLRWSKI